MSWHGVEFVAVARTLKVNPVELFTRFVRAPLRMMVCMGSSSLFPRKSRRSVERVSQESNNAR